MLWLMLGQGRKLENLPEGRYTAVKSLIYTNPVSEGTLHNSSCILIVSRSVTHLMQSY